MQRSVQLAALGVIAIVCGATAIWLLLLRKRLPPEQAERRRRLLLNSHGRLVDGNVSDVRDNDLIYGYSWRGMQYHSSQDVSGIKHLVLGDFHSLIGPVTIKFDVRNPYNSIVICEEWSGFPKDKVSS